MSASRPPLRTNHDNSSFFSDIFKRFPGCFSYSPKFLKEIREFEETLSQELEALKPKGDEQILCLSWLGSAVSVALDMHREAVGRIPPLDIPLLVSDEQWMNEYMDQTTRFLDVCNALTLAISDMEQGNLLLRYACNTLLNAMKTVTCDIEDSTVMHTGSLASHDEQIIQSQKSETSHEVEFQKSLTSHEEQLIESQNSPSSHKEKVFQTLEPQNSHEDSIASIGNHFVLSQNSLDSRKDQLMRSRNLLAEWLNSYVSVGNMNSKKCLCILHKMVEGLVPPKEKEVARGKGFLYALYGANAVAVFVLYMLVLAFSNDEQLLSLSIQLPDLVLWSASISDLIQLAKGEARHHLSCGTNACLVDVINLEGRVVSLLEAVDHLIGGGKAWPLPANEGRNLLAAVNIMNMRLDDIEKKHESLGLKISEMFRVIVASRSELLEKLGNFGPDF